MHDFFDRHPRFLDTSISGAARNRLDTKYIALIERNAHLFKGKRILDLTSHDGRWSHAALLHGATHVTGIEGRKHLIENAAENLGAYGMPPDRYDFIQGDVFEELRKLEPGQFDIVFCFGFLYHTANHVQLISAIERLKPDHLLLETTISASPDRIVEIMAEATHHEFNAMGERPFEVVGWPSRSALSLMLDTAGFRHAYQNWHDHGIGDWSNIEDFRDGTRISLVARRMDGSADAKAGLKNASDAVAAGDFKTAIEHCDRVIARYWFDPQAHYLRGFALQALGEPAQAIEAYDRASAFGYAPFWVRYNRGAAHASVGDREAAIRDIAEAGRLDASHEGVKTLKAALGL
ncbi:MAG: hypothetical protein CMF74_09455 [Maricaulis sp.]|jgi:hypothetical protein|nr:hypothetical protein [Maricaulis sp.]HAQ35252.1 hypothetical protein [Alphaproteobacteria bacterium]